ncbi:MAG: nuclear transport factor 2 family protein [Chloroflexota bacterium]
MTTALHLAAPSFTPLEVTMEHPNAKLAREMYDAFGRGDLDAVRSKYFAPDVVFYAPGNNALTGEHRGADNVFAFFGTVFQLSGGTFHLEIHDVTGSDDHVVGLTDGVGERDGKPFRYHNVHVMHFKDGKLAELWENPEVDKYDAAWHK